MSLPNEVLEELKRQLLSLAQAVRSGAYSQAPVNALQELVSRVQELQEEMVSLGLNELLPEKYDVVLNGILIISPRYHDLFCAKHRWRTRLAGLMVLLGYLTLVLGSVYLVGRLAN